jgi:CAAX prenyl protease-like protein
MIPIVNKMISSAILVRVLPFAALGALTLLQACFGDASQYWIYALKTAVGAWLLWLVYPYVKEMRWKLSWEAIALGLAVFLVWIGLDRHYPMLLHRVGSYNPFRTYGAGSALGWTFIAVRILGSSLVVPPLEEVFYRSFLYRYLIKSDFLQIPLSQFAWRAFLTTGLVFGLGHYEWLSGIICAFAYQGLICRKGRLGDAIAAHAITNFLLGLWVVSRQAYCFW